MSGATPSRMSKGSSSWITSRSHQPAAAKLPAFTPHAQGLSRVSSPWVSSRLRPAVPTRLSRPRRAGACHPRTRPCSDRSALPLHCRLTDLCGTLRRLKSSSKSHQATGVLARYPVHLGNTGLSLWIRGREQPKKHRESRCFASVPGDCLRMQFRTMLSGDNGRGLYVYDITAPDVPISVRRRSSLEIPLPGVKVPRQILIFFELAIPIPITKTRDPIPVRAVGSMNIPDLEVLIPRLLERFKVVQPATRPDRRHRPVLLAILESVTAGRGMRRLLQQFVSVGVQMLHRGLF